MRILQIALITQKGNVFNVKMQIDEIVYESKEEVRQKLLSVFANRKDAIVDVVIHSIQDELELSNYSNEQLKAELWRRVYLLQWRSSTKFWQPINLNRVISESMRESISEYSTMRRSCLITTHAG